MYSVFCQSIFKMKNITFFFSLEKRDTLLGMLQSTKINDSLPFNIKLHPIDFSSSKQQIQFSGFLNGCSQLSNSGQSFQVIRFGRQTRMVGNNLLSKVFARLKIP